MNNLNVLRRTVFLKNLLKNKSVMNGIDRTFYQKTIAKPVPYFTKQMIINVFKTPLLVFGTFIFAYCFAKKHYQFGLVDIEGVQQMIRMDLSKKDN